MLNCGLNILIISQIKALRVGQHFWSGRLLGPHHHSKERGFFSLNFLFYFLPFLYGSQCHFYPNEPHLKNVFDDQKEFVTNGYSGQWEEKCETPHLSHFWVALPDPFCWRILYNTKMKEKFDVKFSKNQISIFLDTNCIKLLNL